MDMDSFEKLGKPARWALRRAHIAKQWNWKGLSWVGVASLVAVAALIFGGAWMQAGRLSSNVLRPVAWSSPSLPALEAYAQIAGREASKALAMEEERSRRQGLSYIWLSDEDFAQPVFSDGKGADFNPGNGLALKAAFPNVSAWIQEAGRLRLKAKMALGDKEACPLKVGMMAALPWSDDGALPEVCRRSGAVSGSGLAVGCGLAIFSLMLSFLLSILLYLRAGGDASANPIVMVAPKTSFKDWIQTEGAVELAAWEARSMSRQVAAGESSRPKSRL